MGTLRAKAKDSPEEKPATRMTLDHALLRSPLFCRPCAGGFTPPCVSSRGQIVDGNTADRRRQRPHRSGSHRRRRRRSTAHGDRARSAPPALVPLRVSRLHTTRRLASRRTAADHQFAPGHHHRRRRRRRGVAVADRGLHRGAAGEPAAVHVGDMAGTDGAPAGCWATTTSVRRARRDRAHGRAQSKQCLREG